MNLYLLCGLAFSGKSTFATAIANLRNAKIISLDEINAERGLYGGLGIPEEEWVVTHHEALRRVDIALSEKKNVVVDDTNCFKFLRDNYRTIGKKFDAKTFVIYFDLEFEIIYKRLINNNHEPRRPIVTETILHELAAKFEIPEDDENVLVLRDDKNIEQWIDDYLFE
jgi:tRNA uridine 5-carbamoylmethylation protein Kti12